MPRADVSGRSVVTRRAVADLVRPAVLSVYGVMDLAAPSLAARVRRALGLSTPGLEVALRPGIEIRLRLVVAQGLPIAEVARQVDSAVRYALRRALGREVASLVIQVDGLRYQPALPAAPPSLEPDSEGPAPPAELRTVPAPASGLADRRKATRRSRMAKTG